MISPGMSSCEHSLNTLRYADRVKELAATDPSETKNSPTDDDEQQQQQHDDKLQDDQTNNSVLSDSDLAQLRSLNVSNNNNTHFLQNKLRIALKRICIILTLAPEMIMYIIFF